MFRGFQILFLLLISPFIIGVFLKGLKHKSELSGKVILTLYALGTGFIIIMSIISILSKKKVLDKSDFYGEYTIDRNYFPGINADWQYNRYRFEIKDNDSIYFYSTDEEKILKTYKGKIFTDKKRYTSRRIKFKMEQPTHHILTDNPTIYREPWDFFMVLNSPKYHNMYFRKGKWKKIDGK